MDDYTKRAIILPNDGYTKHDKKGLITIIEP